MLKKIWNTVTTIVVVLVVILALLLVGTRLLGIQTFVVLSGSMEPHYHVGSVIYVKDVPPDSLQVGDDISFLLNQKTVATHRIVEILPDSDDPAVFYFRTKGTNNDVVDANLVHSKNVLGKVVGTIPLLGYVSDFVQHPPGTYITMGAAAILILVVFLPDMIAPFKKKEDEPAADTKDENEKLKAEIESLKAQIQTVEPGQRKENNNEKD